MKVSHYKQLPEGYNFDYKLDATSKKMKRRGNISALIVMLIVFVITLLIRIFSYGLHIVIDNSLKYLITMIIFIIFMLGYVCMHEIVHGIAYKILTKEKLTFGIKLPVAYCGVKDIYVTKKTALIALLAPFVVFNIVFIVPLFFIKDALYFLLCAYLLAMHVSGCIFDLYDSYLLIFKYKKKEVLLYDDGPTQTFYVKE